MAEKEKAKEKNEMDSSTAIIQDLKTWCLELLSRLKDFMNLNREEQDHKQLRYQFSDLEIITTIGTGTFGRVKLVRHKNGHHHVYALKIMQKAQVVAYKLEANVLDEKNIMAMCDHPNIVKLHQTFKDRKNLYLLMELVQGGDLFRYLRNSTIRKTHYIPDDHARFYAANVLMALEYLHARDIMYRDLKPENLLIDSSGYIKVADFGCAKIVTNRTYTLCGTPEYLAPEMVLRKGHNQAVDYWALGVLIYEMVVGHSPFVASCGINDQMKIRRNIVKGNINYPKWVSPKCRSLIQKFLTKDATKRLGAKHRESRLVRIQPWFANTSWDRLFQRKESAPWIPTISTESNFGPYEFEDEISMDYRDDGSGWDKDF